MESSLEIMETSGIESPTKSEVELSSQVESNGRESHSGTQASHQAALSQMEKASQESSQAVLSPIEVVSSQIKLSQAAAAAASSSSSLPSTSAEALLSIVSSDVENGHAQKKQRIDYKSVSSGVYLDSTVVPILHVALVTLDRLRPVDPVQFLIDFLLKNKAQYSKKIPSGTSANQA